MGRKVKTLAFIYLIGGIMLGAILIFINIGSIKHFDCIRYATIFGGSYYSSTLEEYGNVGLNGLITIFVAVSIIISGIVTYIPLSAFGELVESTNTIEYNIIEKHAEKLALMSQINNNLEAIKEKLK